MKPTLENSNLEAVCRVQVISKREPGFLVVMTARLAEAIKYNVYALPPADIEALIEDFRHVNVPPLASIALDVLADELAKHVSDPHLADQIREFETVEAILLLTALELYFADERANPSCPFTSESYAPFFPVVGIDQE